MKFEEYYEMRQLSQWKQKRRGGGDDFKIQAEHLPGSLGSRPTPKTSAHYSACYWSWLDPEGLGVGVGEGRRNGRASGGIQEACAGGDGPERALFLFFWLPFLKYSSAKSDWWSLASERKKKKLGNRKPGLSSEQTVSATCNLGGNKSELKAGVQNSTLPAASPRPYLGKGYAVFSTEISQQEWKCQGFTRVLSFAEVCPCGSSLQWTLTQEECLPVWSHKCRERRNAL